MGQEFKMDEFSETVQGIWRWRDSNLEDLNLLENKGAGSWKKNVRDSQIC